MDTLPENNEVALSFTSNTLTLALIYSKLQVPMKPLSELAVTSLLRSPIQLLKYLGIRGATLKEQAILKPKCIPGPVSNSKPAPLFSQLIDGIISDHVPQESHIPLENIASDLKTGLYFLLMYFTVNYGCVRRLGADEWCYQWRGDH